MEVITFTLLKDDGRIRVVLDENLVLLIRKRIQESYGSINNFAKIKGYSYDRLVFWLTSKKRRINISILELTVLMRNLKMDVRRLSKYINGYSSKGGHSIINIPDRIYIDEIFMRGIGLYVGDGYTSKKLPRIVFVNTNSRIILFFINWLKKYFKVREKNISSSIYWSSHDKNGILGMIKKSRIHFRLYKNKKLHHKTSCKILLNNSVYRYLLDRLILLSKEICTKNRSFAIGYLKGIMAAEGSVSIRHIHSPELFIEMHLGENIEHAEKIFRFLNIEYKKYKRPLDRMKIAVYKRKQIKRLKEIDIFSLHDEKRNILNSID